MADEPKPLQDTLTADQKPLFEAAIKKAAEDAVVAFKTESETARQKAIPEKYDFKFADNSPLATDAEKIAAFARKQGLSTEQATEFLKHHEELAGGILSRQKQFLTEQVEKWTGEVKGDKDLGGANYTETLANIKRVTDKFGDASPDFVKLVEESGYGSHPAFVKLFNAIGKAMKEDGNSGGGGIKKETKADHEIVYGEKTA